MILEQLTVHNFGVYAGRQTIDLEPPSPEQPIVLIGGKNGEGKTTLLEAILHALYGPHAGPMIGKGGGYERYLRESISRGAAPDQGAAVELSLRVLQGGEQVGLRICRSWRVAGKSVSERLTVSRDGSHDPVLSENWADFIETLIPRG